MSNLITVRVLNISYLDTLYQLEVDFCGNRIILIGLKNDKNIKIDSKLKLSIPSSAIFLIKELDIEINNYLNLLEATILDIEFGKILDGVRLKICNREIYTLISSKIFKKLNLNIGDRVVVALKETQIDIVEVFCD